MIRKASKMFLYKDCYEEYKKRHDELWDDMKVELKEHSAHNYSIFLDEETGQLFAYVEIESEEKWATMADTAICRKWWTYMEPLMETNEDLSPVAVELKSVFYLA